MSSSYATIAGSAQAPKTKAAKDLNMNPADTDVNDESAGSDGHATMAAAAEGETETLEFPMCGFLMLL